MNPCPLIYISHIENTCTYLHLSKIDTARINLHTEMNALKTRLGFFPSNSCFSLKYHSVTHEKESPESSW